MQEERTDKPQWKPTWKDVILSSVGGVSFIGQIVLCFLFYNWLDLDVLLYTGWAILTVGLLLGMMSRRAFEEEGGAREGESWLATTAVVDSGVYAVVRHPMYLSFMLFILALMLISQHWLSPILGAPWIVFLYYAMRGEERANIEKLGEAYKRYMRSVPRMNCVAGIIRLARRPKRE
jgi:protein-S-isoprenylcysteine O-methyltransferase Ste14